MKKEKVTAEIVKITKDMVIKTGERFLNVEILLRDGKTKVEYKRGYPIDTPTKDIKADLQAIVANYEREKETAAAQAELDAQEAQADKTIEEAEGLKV